MLADVEVGHDPLGRLLGRSDLGGALPADFIGRQVDPHALVHDLIVRRRAPARNGCARNGCGRVRFTARIRGKARRLSPIPGLVNSSVVLDAADSAELNRSTPTSSSGTKIKCECCTRA
jgi:hypothetical protein